MYKIKQRKQKPITAVVLNTHRNKASRSELLVSGYIHENEQQFELYMNIPNGLISMVTSFYPTLIGFGIHNKTHFIVSEHGTILRGHNAHSCSGYMVYAFFSEQDKNGYNSGVHTWSLLSLSPRSSHCYQSIGITTHKPSQAWIETKTSHWPHDNISINDNFPKKYFYAGYNEIWEQNEVVSVRLNCNDWTVTFFKGIRQIKFHQIMKYRSYYLALSCCASSSIVHLKSVPFPADILYLMHK